MILTKRGFDYKKGFAYGFVETMCSPLGMYRSVVRDKKLKEITDHDFEVHNFGASCSIDNSRQKLKDKEEYMCGYKRGIFNGYLNSILTLGIGNVLIRLAREEARDDAKKVVGFMMFADK